MKRVLAIALVGGFLFSGSASAQLLGGENGVLGALLGADGLVSTLLTDLPVLGGLASADGGLPLVGGFLGDGGLLAGLPVVGPLLLGENGLLVSLPIVGGLLGGQGGAGGLPIIGGLLGSQGGLLGGLPIVGVLLSGEGGLLAGLPIAGGLLSGQGGLLGGLPLVGGLLGGGLLGAAGGGMPAEQIPLPLADMGRATVTALVNGVKLPGL